VQSSRRFLRFSALVVCATLGVILWGAYVRASGSGAGCGSHWPTCNGEVIPRPRSTATVIEFTHRASSGLAFLLVAAQGLWALRAFPRRHPVRRAAGASFLFMVTEALVGAGLVLFEMVAGNKSVARAAWIAAHLTNTLALLASLALTVWWARAAAAADGEQRGAGREGAGGPWRPALLVGLAGLVLVATSGAVVALGDTLFPARSLAEGMAQDFAPTAHVFLRLRIVHPVLAVGTALYLLVVAGLLAARDPSGRVRPLATGAAVLVLGQVTAGFLNFVLLAPTALQLVHLLLADLVWLAFVVLTAAVWKEARGPVPAGEGVEGRPALPA
jgi:heme A synthase